MEKKKKLEDVMPAETISRIAGTANFLREVELIEKTDADYFTKHSTAVQLGLSALSIYKKIDASDILNQLSYYRDYLIIKSLIETVICTQDLTYKTKLRGLFKYSYAETYYIARIAEELKQITGKANYGILEDFLERQGIGCKENMPLFILRAKPVLFHINEVLESHKAVFEAYLKTLQK